MEKVLVFVVVCSFYILTIRSSVVKRSASCKSDEMFVECAYCGPKTCDDLGYPIRCGGATGICKPECVCVDGLVRDANGKCIPKTECPGGCAGDKNATSGCGNHCGNSCSDYLEVNKTCYSGCRYNSCDCKPGFVYNEKLKLCTLFNNCYNAFEERCFHYCDNGSFYEVKTKLGQSRGPAIGVLLS